MFYQILKFYRHESQNIAINQQLKIYENQTKLLSQSNDKVRSFRHDYKNHIMLLKQYLQNEMYQEALQYTDKMSENIENVMEIVKTGNTGVDSILNYLLGQVDTTRYDL
ncbi:MAG: Spo0B domain-containing protein, partial [Eubacterium sp.]|nr:Spo0B domain-containing protein [Eubacterium sp.]